MKNKARKTSLIIAGAVVLCAAIGLAVPAVSAAFEKLTGQNKTGQNCERQDTKWSSTFGKCESVCKDKELVRDSSNHRWVCKGGNLANTNTGTTRSPAGKGDVLGKTPGPLPKTVPVTRGKVGKIRS